MHDRKKIMVVFGTRPEAVKLTPVILALKEQPRLLCRVCVTAQHRDLLDQVLAVFGISPDLDLDLMQPNQGLAALTASAVGRLYETFRSETPDLVLVQGDTTSVFCASLAAFYCRVPVGHIEAGLRTGNLQAPWPEEANRVLTSHLSSLHFAPTESARQNLLREGIPDERIHVTGNTVVDTLLRALPLLQSLPPQVESELRDLAQVLGSARVVLVTGHRRESFGVGLAQICRAIRTLAIGFPETHFVYPVHPNPNVREAVEQTLRTADRPNIHLVEPLSYLAFVWMMNRAHVILTDSGGVQEEAPSLGKPVLVMRDTTERPEGLAAGSSRLVGSDEGRIVAEVSRLLTDDRMYEAMSRPANPYGDGKAAGRIVRLCDSFLSTAG